MLDILIVEDSSTVSKILQHLITQQYPLLRPHYATSMAAAQALCAQSSTPFFAAIADLGLPDAPNGEVVDYLIGQKLPVIVLTADYQDERREALMAKGIVDYIVKDCRYSYHNALKLVQRLERNQHVKILVAEDSTPARRLLKNLLTQHLYQVIEASNGKEALAALAQYSDIKLLITDYHMPEMDGFELVRAIRQNIEKSALVIIGLSGDAKGALSAKFIKAGANDFLQKPFLAEELHCRVMHNIEELELIEAMRDRGNRDVLTGLYNRHHFFDLAEPIHAQAVAQQNPAALAIIDVDNFRQINDSYGHHVGDAVLAALGSRLQRSLSRFLLARMNGVEFCVLMAGLNNDQAVTVLDKMRDVLAAEKITIEGGYIPVSLSAGVTNQLGDNLDKQISRAQQLLHRAKEAGRDIVIGDDEL